MLEQIQMTDRKIFIVGSVGQVDSWPFLSTDDAFSQTGNTGNLLFFTAVRRHIGNHINVNFSSGIGNDNDIAVIPCANHIGNHANNLARYTFCKSFPGTIVAIGLGAQMSLDDKALDLSKDTIGFMEALACKGRNGVPNISVRGGKTKQVFEKYGLGDAVTVLGCPSLFLNPCKKLGRYIQARIKPEPKRIAIAAGSPHAGGKYGNVEKKLVCLLDKYHGSYIIQHPINSVKLSRGESKQVPRSFIENYRNAIKPDMPVNRFVNWFARHSKVFFNIDCWIDFLSSYDLLIGTRIHGCMMAIQAGKPALCLVHDSRTKEMCQTMKIPFVEIGKDDLGFIDTGDFGFMADFDWSGFDDNRENLRKNYIDFLTSNQLSISGNNLLSIGEKAEVSQ